MRLHLTILALALLAVPPAAAERVPLDAAGLNAESTHVLTGTVKAVYSRDVQSTLYGAGTVETHSVLEIEVEAVEKGDNVKPKDVVYARCWRLKQRGADGLRPGPSGHFVPADGARVRVYLHRGNYPPTGQTDNGFAVVYPNGIELTPAAKK
ncbi:MAG TPA: hypothetical protein VGF55_10165 [Gemmataceae bacterium]